MKERLRALARQAAQITSEASSVEIGDDDFLPDILDSLALAALLTMIEEEWSVHIDDAELDPAHFTDVESIAAFISKKIGDRPADR